MTISDEAIKLAAAARNLAGAWGITLYGVLTSHATAIAFAVILSGLQIYVLVRDKILGRRGARDAARRARRGW